MEPPIFKTKPIGRVGPYRVGREYMHQIEERAAKMERACMPQPVKDKRQLKLPGVK